MAALAEVALCRSSRSFLLFLLVLLLVPACAHVPAYDRGHLAHPTMSTSDLDGPGEEHVRAVQEGATGGGSSVGGGCGCRSPVGKRSTSCWKVTSWS